MDEATGLYDYGARYYDPAIARFPSIDRFAEKYAHQSPYVYAANDPIKYIDVNGDSIWISHKGANYLYDGGKLYHNGDEYQEKIKGFLKTTFNALNKLNTTDEGSNIILDLSRSHNSFFIEKSGTNWFVPNDYGERGINIVTNNTYALQVLEQGERIAKHLPFTQIGDGGTIRWTGSDALELGHELVHGHDANFGLLDTRSVEINGGQEEIREIRAVYSTNQMRLQMGKRLRRNYSNGPSLLNSKGMPINYTNPHLYLLNGGAQ